MAQTDKLPPKDTVTDSSNMSDKYLTLSKLYVLAEKLIDEITKTTVLDELYACGQKQDDKGIHSQPGLLTIRTIYNGTSDSSEAREWLVDLYTTHIGDEASFNLFPHAKNFPQEFLADLVFSMINFRPLPTQLTSLKNKLARVEAQAEAQAEAHFRARQQLKDQFVKTEAQLKSKLTQTEEQLKKKTASYESVCKGMITVDKARDEAQNARATLEEDLRKARAEVAMLKRRPESTGTTSTWDRPAPDLYRKR